MDQHRRQFLRGAGLAAAGCLGSTFLAGFAMGAGNDEITGFGYKMAWLAVEGGHAARIIDALGLRDVGPVDWKAGLDRAYEWDLSSRTGYGRHVFIAPPIDGWTLCVGTGLFAYTDDDGSDFGKRIAKLSRDLDTRVQYFGTHRVVEAHSWALAERGQLIRAYYYLGESGQTFVDIGPKTVEEVALGFAFFDERLPQAQSDGYWDRTDLDFPGENHVMALAGAWSISPVDLDGRRLPSAQGRLAAF